MQQPQVAPVRVLQVVGTMGLGGAEAMVMNMYRTLDRQRVQFDFLVFSETQGAYEAEIEEMGGRVIRMPAPSRVGALQALRTMADVMRTEGPFVAMHSHVNSASGLAVSAAWLAGIDRRVAHSHIAGRSSGGFRQALYERIARTVILRASTDIVACGQDAGAHLFGGKWTERGRTLPNAIDVERFLNADIGGGARALQVLGIAPHTLVLGCVARLTHQKNHAFVLQVMAELAHDRLPFALVLVGEGDLRHDLETEARQLGLADQVLFVGARHDIPQLLKAFDLLLLPSHYEGLPVVLVEAQAAGTRCLVSEAVTQETDLGLGLLEYLPLDVGAWASRIRGHSTGRSPTGEEIRTALCRRGYAAPDAAAQLLSIYGLADG